MPEPRNSTLTQSETLSVRRTPMFAALSEAAFTRLLAASRAQWWDRGAVLFDQDVPADRMFACVAGWLKLSRFGEDGTETVVHVVGPGETFAEAAMFGGRRFPVAGTAATDVKAVTIPAQAIAQLLRGDEAATFAMLGSMSLRLRQLVGELERRQTRSASERVAEFLLRLAESPVGGGATSGEGSGRLPLDKRLIAERLGMRPETFSRALARLRKLGVTVDGAHIAVSDRAALARAARGDDDADADAKDGGAKNGRKD